ncbi:ribosome maturation factor RimP [Hathewaya limosa]|uniref:Ribosome maturation factor RimP n=1 Tax=Hathewaya limosa TaxID=1536 RepID=A0ABU0JVG3_HATLI|nr:ribosome maturation factor RimP [Hathewaya limosa]MDQ0480128.1 ribosome maturation factor RimP [Hathewaya limosa]
MTDELMKKLNNLIKPIVEKSGYELYHLEFVKEGGEDYLRVYIDNEQGIILDDCVKVNKLVSEALDVEDLIKDFYYLEISSPGIERVLHNDKHLQKYMGFNVKIKLKNLVKGKKKLEGILKGLNEENVVINLEEEEISLNRNNIITISLKGEY